ncbi:MAG: hypothetical protein PF638_08160 [Candidatus Delongbacteria bacterium]|jgi:hypothetical protein|nr:hypothetical protein [Candidatus Delongbacteria bacterium]
MAKRKTTKKKKKATQSSFMDTIFSLLIIGALLYGGYYFLLKDSSFFERSVDDIKEKVKDISEPTQKDKIEKEVIPSDEDAMNMQFEDEISDEIESISGDIDTFEDQILYYSKKYNGLRFKNGGDPDKDKATDNSHLICKIYQHAAENSGMKFKGYMQMDEIRKNIHNIKSSSLRNGDLLKLNNGMLAMVINLSSADAFDLIYASDSKNSVVITKYDQLKYYWLKPENFNGFYRLNEDVLK